MNARRVRELKLKYVVSLIELLRTVCEAGERSEEHLEAIQQIEHGLLRSIDYTPHRRDCDFGASFDPPDLENER